MSVHLGELIDRNDPAETDPYIGWWTHGGRIILGERLMDGYDTVDSHCYVAERTGGALTVLNGCGYDPGSAVYRFHNALNQATPHASAFFRFGFQNPYTNYRQWDMWRNRDILTAAVGTADVIVCHVDTMMLGYSLARPRRDAAVCMYYHGSEHPDKKLNPMGWRLVIPERDAACGLIQMGARLNHQDYGDLAWVPMAQPVRRYHVLRAMYSPPGYPGVDRPFRIAHSPTAHIIKGTDDFLSVCDELRAEGVKVEAVLIDGHKQDVALAWKATCDACFDSFWLGMQGSGLEAAAMGMPVLAGDENNKRLYLHHVGYLPYTFVRGRADLKEAVAALVLDQAFYIEEGMRVHHYVRTWHSYERVAAMFLNAVYQRTRHEWIKKAIDGASRTPPILNTVEPMRPHDDLPWLREDGGNRVPQIVHPHGEPVCIPGRRITVPVEKPIHSPQREEPYVSRAVAAY